MEYSYYCFFSALFGGFNQPDDIGLDERYEALCGITKEELYTTFDEQIKAMAARYKVSENEMKYKLKRKFDGYHFSPNMLYIYNPFSILNTLNKKILADYWFATGRPTYLVRLLSHCKENLNKLTGKYYLPNSFMCYNPEMPWYYYAMGFQETTPIQMLAFYNAIANKSKIASPSSIAYIRKMLEEVVSNGLANRAMSDKVKVAGMNGTIYKTPLRILKKGGLFLIKKGENNLVVSLKYRNFAENIQKRAI